MMKKCLLCCLLLSALATGYARHPARNISGKALEKNFIAPPASVQTSVYWYWLSGNISVEGVIKDLEAMKKAGINRAFIGNISPDEKTITPGPVTLFSDEWWTIVHAALKRATELDIEIGMFNCPGWSQAGGPWIESRQAMRYLTSAKIEVSGGRKLYLTLPVPEPGNDFQDVKLLASPRKAGKEMVLKGDLVPNADLGHTLSISVRDTCFTVRSITIRPTAHPIHCRVQVTDKGVVIKEVEIRRTNASPEVGFDPYAPIAIGIPETASTDLQLLFSQMNQGSAIREIRLSSLPCIERYPEKSLAKMYQEPLPYWHEYMWQPSPDTFSGDGAVHTTEIIDITEHLSGNRLVWDAPEGEWDIFRFGMLPTTVENGPAAIEGRGPEVDKLTPAYLQHHFDAFIGKILKRIPAKDRKTFRVVVADSYEKGGQNFSDTFLDDFYRRYNYDPLPFLLAYRGIVVESPDVSDRFLWDMRRLVADKLSYDHIGALRKIAQSHNMRLWLENYGHWGFPGEFLQYGGQSDEISGEFWSEGTLGDIENRAAASCGHIYGKNNISAESFTSGGPAFSRHPAMMKRRGDRFFAEGINNTLLHVYIAQSDDETYPGINTWFGTEFNRKNTWFSHFDLFTDYLKRCNYMLQQGLNVADVAYFIGEDVPKMTGITDPPLPSGYQYDYINAEVIIRDMTVKNGLFTLPHGTQYRLLALPPQATMRPEVLRKIKQLVLDGGCILGTKPSCSPSLENYPQADGEVKALAELLWNNIDGERIKMGKVGKGTVMSNMSMAEALAATSCRPDCVVSDGAPVLYAHRVAGDKHIYFLTNQSDDAIDFDANFRVSGQMPELWNPVDGSIKKVAGRQQGETVGVSVRLAPSQSLFVVFRKPADKAVVENRNTTVGRSKSIDISHRWNVSFQSDSIRRGPTESVLFERLTDLSLHPDERIRHYSGVATYETSFELTADDLCNGTPFLDIEQVGVMAKIYLNGEYVGGLWTAPYRLDIGRQARQGQNILRIEVVNNWVNRMIGDLKLPDTARRTRATNNPFTAETPLQPSGLIGKATIVVIGD
jgi:hypothetical protein